MSKHTPGPWKGVGPSFGGQTPRYTAEIVTDYKDWDNEVHTICEFPFAHHDEENEANARLIAAAPELLHILKAAREYIIIDRDYISQSVTFPDGSVGHGEQALLDLIDQRLAKIDAVIAKAETP